MKSQISTPVISAAAMLFLAACGTTTTVYDPASTQTNIRQEDSISSEEMRQVARAAAQGAMTNAKFESFLRKYKKEMNDPDAIPVLKLDNTINDTDDPALNVSEINDMLNEGLINSGKVDVIMAEGADRTQAIANSRKLEDDENFDQKTVAQRNTLQAARLILRPKVISNEVSDGNRKAITRTFVMDMMDVKTGLIMWKFTKQLSFIKEKKIIGW